MNKKKFVFLTATPDLRIEWSGNESAEYLTTVRFPSGNAMHDEVKRFCERAKPGGFLQTTYNFIFCSDDKKAELGGTSVSSNPTIYIAGKITGLDYQEAFDKFERAENDLIAQGYEPINPMKKVLEQEGKTWAEYMCEDMPHLFSCEAIYLLPDWYDSKGARIEFAVARELGLTILFSTDNGNNTVSRKEYENILAERNEFEIENEKLREVIASRGKLF
jgi:hypothetical protein